MGLTAGLLPTPVPVPKRGADDNARFGQPQVPAEPAPPIDPPSGPPGRPSRRIQFANWMESTFGRAYLPIAAAGAGTITGAAGYAVGKAIHGPKLGVALAIPSALVGAFYGALLVFAD